MAKKRAHILSAVNASNVSKAGNLYTIKDVCGAVDDIVMNSVLYPADQLAAGAPSMESKPAPAGHPKNAAGQAISASNGEAMLTSYIGAICRNSRHEGGRTLTDIVVNEAQARSHADGLKLIERLDAAIAGTNSEPIHVSTGLFYEPIATNGERRGKKYQRIATNIRYDHLAILLNERGAGTPADGVGMYLNEAGQPEEIEEFALNTDPEDQRSTGLKAWVMRLVGNGATELSFDQITSGLYRLLPEGCWLLEVWDRYAVWSDRDGTHFRQDYSVSSDGSLAFSGTAQKVRREVTYVPITNRNEDDQVKETIIAALNAAGISGVAAMTDPQLIDAFKALNAQPHINALAEANAKLTAANSKIAEFELAANAAKDAELTTLATELATNSVLKAEDFKAMGLERCKELKATNKSAAPILPAGGGEGGKSSYEGYSINEIAKEAK